MIYIQELISKVENGFTLQIIRTISQQHKQIVSFLGQMMAVIMLVIEAP